MVFIDFLTFFIALIILIKGSDILVGSASSFAKNIGISEFIIGLTVVSIGTSIPELATGISASLNGNSNLIMGVILGSNIANIGLILGIVAVISLLKIDKAALYRDGIFLLSASILFLLMAFDRQITSLEGLMLLVLFLGYMYHLVKTKSEDKFGYEQYLSYIGNIFNPLTYARFIDRIISRNYRGLARHYIRHVDYSKKPATFIKHSSIILFSIVVIIISSSYLVPSATNIASFFGISQTIIGFVMIAIGTSLPELIVSLTAIRRKLNNIFIGNIIGSNIANLMLVGGVSAVISPIVVNKLALFYMLPFMLFLTLLFLVFIRTNWFMRKLEGIVLLILYFSFITFIFLIV